MDKETVLKPLERLITLLSNTEYESEALEVKKEIESILLFSIQSRKIYCFCYCIHAIATCGIMRNSSISTYKKATHNEQLLQKFYSNPICVLFNNLPS
ncbi:hypothetical protein ACIQ7N_04465 [Lysinibacillus sp. NPDC095746]|uniref:hypothetical protein n=1 Tax=Lysinibacillus sp. NPDC095746 TaxID=3364134 RepID=UPI00380AEDE8